MTRALTKIALCLMMTVLVGLPSVASAALASQRDSGPDVERLYDAGLYEQAVKVLNASLEANPNNAATEDALGRCFYQLGDFNRAISSLEHAVMLDPNRSDSHDWLGKAYGRKAEQANPFSAMGFAKRAHREFTEAVRLNASNLVAQRDLIRYLLNAPGIVGGGLERAEEQIRALAVVDATEGELARAEADVVHKKFEASDQDYGKLLAMPHRRIGVYFEIAEYYRDRGNGEMMQKAVDQAAALDPNDLRLNYYRGVALVLANKDSGNAERDLRTYLDSVPANSELPPRSSAREFLGRLYEQEHKLDSAAEQYRDGLALDPRNRSLREGLRRVEKK
jgi:tetratricopeptide (TPR) repeat protein